MSSRESVAKSLDKKAKKIGDSLAKGTIHVSVASKKILGIIEDSWELDAEISDDGLYPELEKSIELIFSHPESSAEFIYEFYRTANIWHLSSCMSRGLSRHPLMPIFIDSGIQDFNEMLVELIQYSLLHNVPRGDEFQAALEKMKDLFGNIQFENSEDFFEEMGGSPPRDDPFYWASRLDSVDKIFRHVDDAWPNPLEYMFQ